MKRALKRHGQPEAVVTDGLRSYPAAMRELGNPERREMGRHLNNRVENSHLPFRRRERAMLRFRQMKSYKNWPRSMLLRTTISIPSAISLVTKPSANVAPPHGPSGNCLWAEAVRPWDGYAYRRQAAVGLTAPIGMRIENGSLGSGGG